MGNSSIRKFARSAVALMALLGQIFFMPGGAGQGFGTPAWAADSIDSTALPTNSSNALINDALPPSFTIAQAQQFSAMTSNSCLNTGLMMDGLLQSLQDATKSSGSALSSNALGGANASFNIKAACPGTPAEFDPSSMTCDSVKDASGTVSKKKIDALKSKIQQGLSYASCQKNKITAVQNEISCLQQTSSALAQEAKAMQDAYLQSYNRWQADVAKIKAVITDRTNQGDFLSSRLNGDKKSGFEGLKQIQQDLDGVLTNMPQEVQQVQSLHATADQSAKAYSEQVSRRTSGLAMDCFSKRTNAGYTCNSWADPTSLEPVTYPWLCVDVSQGATVPPGRIGCVIDRSPKSAKDAILCRFWQNNMAQPGGALVNDADQAQKAMNAYQGLKSVLNQIATDAPSSASIPQNAQDAQAQMDQGDTIYTAADVENQFGSELSSFSAPGLNVHDLVMSTVGSCFQRSTSIVNTEVNQANSSLGVAQFKMQDDQRKTNAVVSGLLDKYSTAYYKATDGLLGTHTPINTSLCKNGTSSQQDQCMTDMENNLTSLKQGTGPNSNMVLQVPAVDPNSAFTFQCQGVDGCVTAMQTTITNLTTQTNSMNQLKQNYVLQANQSFTSWARGLTPSAPGSPTGASSGGILQQISIQTKGIQDRVNNLNSALTMLGVPGFRLQPVKTPELAKDDDGLPKPPNDMMAYLGSQANPPMLDMSGDAMGDVADALGPRLRDIQKEQGNLTTAEQVGLASLQACSQGDLTKAVDKVREDMNALNNCTGFREWCEDPAHSQSTELDNLKTEVGSALRDNSNSDVSSIADLLDGAAANCTRSQPLPTGENGYLKGKEEACSSVNVSTYKGDFIKLKKAASAAAGSADGSDDSDSGN